MLKRYSASIGKYILKDIYVLNTPFTRALETHICDDWRQDSDSKDASDFIAHFPTVQSFRVANVPRYVVGSHVSLVLRYPLNGGIVRYQ